ncbi:ABC transporter family substrate-binding protein [Haloglycomyces albus]|uniref:ABC transporter family substrate-binding protein n=1 Tax=Haloglycomyces albus TaxID=526067 RepID=UPI0004A44E8B|nr:ABC transporter family substrate-binding protein [Haloglycomyces albus]
MTLKKRAVGGVAIAASTALVLSACGGGSDDGGLQDANVGYEDCEDNPTTCNSGDVADGGEVTWAVSDEWSGWNWTRSDANTTYLSQTMRPMFPDVGDFNPAAEWEFNEGWFEKDPEVIEEDPQTVEYTLKEGAGWSDGTPFSVDDAIYSWYTYSGNEEFCDEQCSPASSRWGSNVADVAEGENDNSIVVTYKDGYLNPEWFTSTLFTHPTHIIEENGFEDWKSDPSVMGESSVWLNETAPTWSSGPYVPTQTEMGQFVIYEPNENWMGTQPAIDELTVQSMSGGLSTMVDAQRNNEIDGGSPADFNTDEVAKLREANGINWRVGKGGSWSHIDLNTQSEFLGDLELRKAIFTAIDVEGILEKTYNDMGVEKRGNHIFDRDSKYYEDYVGDANQGFGDIDGAMEILEDAGYVVEDDQLMTPDGEAVELEMRAGATNTVRQQTAELLLEQLKQIGVKLNLNPIQDGKLGEVLSNAEYDMVMYGWSGNPAFTVAPGQYWRSDSGSNWGGLEVDGMDELVDNVRGTLDIDEAADYANQATELVVENAYVLPFNSDPEVAMASDDMINVRPNGNSQVSALYNVEEWGLAS